MAHVYIFAEQVRSIVRSGKTEIRIPAGARISSAAADLIKEHHIQIKTVAPGMASSHQSTQVKDLPTNAADKTNLKKLDPAIFC